MDRTHAVELRLRRLLAVTAEGRARIASGVLREFTKTAQQVAGEIALDSSANGGIRAVLRPESFHWQPTWDGMIQSVGGAEIVMNFGGDVPLVVPFSMLADAWTTHDGIIGLSIKAPIVLRLRGGPMIDVHGVFTRRTTGA